MWIFLILKTVDPFFFFSIARGQQQVAQSTFSNVIVFKLGIHERLDMESKRLSAWFEC